ncbi:sensor histidine kinase [Vagococcus luciliae]|uniref:histidine kinase n=1 Tax=Vagococcus luciliae TaxID=2920380 RepID=A0ABY5NZ34_9ENTE|nr:HAMP domain-containing sensor histidine kinase [Vagococcus luciliae]UUV98741.1 Adaptive-response sensory-kinase SasA [Vagococcus luciliae]
MKSTASKKQRLRFFLINCGAFAVIFSLLSFITIQVIQYSAYTETDSTLERMASDPSLLDREIRMLNKDGKDSPIGTPKFNFDGPNNQFNTVVVLWDKNGKILNDSSVKDRLENLEEPTLDKKNTDIISTLSLKNKNNDSNFSFRSITISPSENNLNIAYIQVLVNVNQIDEAVKQSRLIILICMFIFWILSLVISYGLSDFAMKPILKSWKKQQEFVENASHELRTPLTIIRLNLEKLFTHPNNTIIDESETIAQALNEAQRLTKLTSDLLLLAKGDSNTLILDKETIDTNTFIHKVLDPFQLLAEEQEKQLIFKENKSFNADIDVAKLHQVLLILLDNAFKYTKTGDSITVTSSITNKKQWEVSIKNSGPHINEDKLNHIFTRFYREDDSRNKETGGNGLGLSIAKQIIEEHGGNIQAKNLTPVGVSFTFRLPLMHVKKPKH